MRPSLRPVAKQNVPTHANAPPKHNATAILLPILTSIPITPKTMAKMVGAIQRPLTSLTAFNCRNSISQALVKWFIS